MLLLATWNLAACAPTISVSTPPRPSRNSLEVQEAETRHCLRLATRFVARDEHVVGPERPAPVTSAIPPSIRRIAQAADIDPALERLIADDGAGDRSVELRLQLFTRLSSLEIQLGALLFEADCVGDQMEAVLDELGARQRKREIALAVSSILLGAGAGIGAGVYELRGRPPVGIPVIGIVGGVAAAGLGLAAFIPGRGPVVYRHPRNLLAPIIAGDDPEHLYPEFVLRMLMLPTDDGSPTARELLLEDWQRILDDVPAAQRELAEQVLYGEGGVYDAALVDVRERMFDALESHLNSIQRDLELLYLFTDRVITRPRAVEPPPPADSDP